MRFILYAYNENGHNISDLKKIFLDLRKKNKNYNYFSSMAPKP